MIVLRVPRAHFLVSRDCFFFFIGFGEGRASGLVSEVYLKFFFDRFAKELEYPFDLLLLVSRQIGAFRRLSIIVQTDRSDRSHSTRIEMCRPWTVR